MGGIDGPINELADRWTDEQMDGWISGWVNGWMDRHFYTWLSVCIPVMSKADFSPSSDVCTCACVYVYACVHIYRQQLLFLCVRTCVCVSSSCVQQTGYLGGMCLRRQDDIYSEGQIWFQLGPFPTVGSMLVNPVRFCKYVRQHWLLAQA